MTCPSGCNKGALKYMTQKASNWKDMIQVGKLSRRYVWFMMEKQFWPRVLYGLCAVSASYEELSECLMKVYIRYARKVASSAPPRGASDNSGLDFMAWAVHTLPSNA
jgi:hypothetical protein